MRAATIHQHGGLECVQVEEDFPEPEAGPGDVVVDVKAAALNHLDIWVRQGSRELDVEKPLVLGSDAAGVVAELGPRVEGLSPGDEIVINPGLSCGHCEFCMRGEHSECTSFGVMGMTRQGTFAERVAVPVENVFPKPAHLNFTQAAALPLSHLTAWRMLLTRAEVQAGESVLIHGIGGGVALAGLQIAKMIGTETVVTSSSDAKLDRARELGADHLLNYKEVDDLADHMVEAVGGRGVDVAFDAVGAETWPVDFAAVRKGGRIVLCGITTGPIARTNLQQLYWRQLTVMGSTLGSHEEMRSLLRAVDVERLEPVVDSTQPLSEAQDAMRRMQEGRQFGKIVLEMPG